MATNIDFRKLDPELRTIALVGRFLQTWAIMEDGVNGAIGGALKLDTLQTTIVVKNMQFTAKTHVLRAAVNLAILTRAEGENFDKTLVEMQSYAPIRNMMAHDLFLADEKSDGVQFLVAKAKGKLKFPDEIWSVEKFDAEYDRVMDWDEQMQRLADRLKTKPVNALLASALKQWEPPTLGQAGLDRLNPQLRHTPTSLDSNHPLATDETDERNSPDPIA